MVRTDDVRQLFIQPLFVMNFIENPNRIKDKMRPNFLQTKYFWKPFITAKQNQEKRVKKKKGDDSIRKK